MKKQHSADTHRIDNPVRQLKELVKKRLLTVPEAASYIGRTVEATKKLYYRNQFPIIKADRRIFVDIQDLDRWIERCKFRYEY